MYSIHFKKGKTSVVLLLCFLLAITCFIMTPQKVSAADLNIRYFPSADNLDAVKTRNLLNINMYTLTDYEWHGVDGVVRNNTGGETDIGFYVPVKGTTRYDDFIDLKFENVGKTQDGRILNAEVHFDYVISKDETSPAKEYARVFRLAENKLSLHSENTYIETSFTTKVTYADTGETVDKSLLLSISDVDVYRSNNTYYNEAWRMDNGFAGDIWIWDTCESTISGNKISASYGMATEGDAQWLESGCVLPTNNGEFKNTVFLSGTAGSYLQVSLANDTLPAPKKTSDAKDINVDGDTIEYTITQEFGEFYGNVMTEYRSFVMEDTLPKDLIYKSATVTCDGKDMTSNGTLTYDKETRSVKFALSSDYLENAGNYKGQIFKLNIKAEVDGPSTPKTTLKNIATTSIDQESLSSNAVSDVAAIEYGVKYTYVNGSPGRELPHEIKTTSGEFAVSDNNTYYAGDTVNRKKSPADGTKYEVYDDEGNLKGEWILTWDKGSAEVVDKDIEFIGTWEYHPVPYITLMKKIPFDEKSFNEAHGEPTFIFKISAESSGKEWYKSITLDNDIVNTMKEDQVYTTSHGTQMILKEGFIYAMSERIALPEDDYTVKEIAVSRYENINTEAYYYGNDTTLISDGKDSLLIPLKFSEYESDDKGYNADMAIAIFTNTKKDHSLYSQNQILINELKGAIK